MEKNRIQFYEIYHTFDLKLESNFINRLNILITKCGNASEKYIRGWNTRKYFVFTTE